MNNKIKDDYTLPKDLPIGLTDFEAWMQETLEAAGAPINDSSKFALAVQVLHLGPTECDKPREHFIRSLKKAMASQVASQVINDLKEKQKAAEEAAKASAANEKQQ